MTTGLPLERKKILTEHVTEPHLPTHAPAGSVAMKKVERHFQENTELGEAIGDLQNVHYQRFPEEHGPIPKRFRLRPESNKTFSIFRTI